MDVNQNMTDENRSLPGPLDIYRERLKQFLLVGNGRIKKNDSAIDHMLYGKLQKSTKSVKQNYKLPLYHTDLENHENISCSMERSTLYISGLKYDKSNNNTGVTTDEYKGNFLIQNEFVKRNTINPNVSNMKDGESFNEILLLIHRTYSQQYIGIYGSSIEQEEFQQEYNPYIERPPSHQCPSLLLKELNSAVKSRYPQVMGRPLAENNTQLDLSSIKTYLQGNILAASFCNAFEFDKELNNDEAALNILSDEIDLVDADFGGKSQNSISIFQRLLSCFRYVFQFPISEPEYNKRYPCAKYVKAKAENFEANGSRRALNDEYNNENNSYLH